MSFALGLMLTAAAGFADLDAIDRQVAAFTGSTAGQPGGATMPVDRRLRLQACLAPVAVGWNGSRRDSVIVQCPGSWRIFVQITSAAAAGMGQAPQIASAPAVTRGDAVTIAVQGNGFSVSQPGEAVEGGPIGAWIRVRPVKVAAAAGAGSGETLRAQIVRPGMVAIPLP